ncbi:MAG: hypothetical protein V1921_06825 [Candidatus Altiarchaeota archaeon]
MNIETSTAVLLALVVISGCIGQTTTTTTVTSTTTLATTTVQSLPMENETSCSNDIDCACGVHTDTGRCFYGNSRYVDVTRQCPDFCSGYAGNLRIKCVEGECVQVTTEWK